jgi:4'-phosphopantetheinyl transferase
MKNSTFGAEKPPDSTIMPLTSRVTTGLYTYGVWHILETTDWFLEHVHLSEAETAHFHSIRNETVRKQWLACRMILSGLLPEENREILYNTHGKPFLQDQRLHISLSHSGEFAAVIVSDQAPVGIDIEKEGPRILRVAGRFMTPGELENANGEHFREKLYIHWCAKEAVYKMLGDPDLNLFCDIILEPFDYLCTESGDCVVMVDAVKNLQPQVVHYGINKDYYLVFIVLNEGRSPDG